MEAHKQSEQNVRYDNAIQGPSTPANIMSEEIRSLIATRIQEVKEYNASRLAPGASVGPQTAGQEPRITPLSNEEQADAIVDTLLKAGYEIRKRKVEICGRSIPIGDDPYFAVCKLPEGHDPPHRGRGYEWT